MAWRTILLVSIIIVLVGAVLYIAFKTIPEQNDKKYKGRYYRNRYGQLEYNTTNNYYYDASGNKL